MVTLYKVKDGIQVKLTQEEVNEYNQRQLSDEDLLQLSKDKKIKKLNAVKSQALYTPIQYNGSTFINSEVAGNNLQASYTFADEPVTWLDIDSNPIELTKSQIKDLIGIMLQHRSSIYHQEATMINQINNCSSIEEVQVIDVNQLGN